MPVTRFLLLGLGLLCIWPESARTLSLVQPHHAHAKTICNHRKQLDQYHQKHQQSYCIASHSINPASIAACSIQAKASSILAYPCADELDRKITKLLLPALLNYDIVPLVGAADTYWIGRMQNALAVAGQGAANQIFHAAFLLLSFMPSVITPLVAKARGAGDAEAVKDRVGEAFFISTLIGIFGTILLAGIPGTMLSIVLKDGVSARLLAQPYLRIRALTFLPAMLSTAAFAVFRGSLDVVTPLRISLLSNAVNLILDPILIFYAGMGVTGAAAATCVSEVIAVVLYTKALISMNMMRTDKLWKPPARSALMPLLLGGLSIQMRSIALNAAMLAVMRTTQQLDATGTAAAANAITMQMYQLGSVVSLAMSTVATVVIPTERAKYRVEQVAGMQNDSHLALLSAKQAADRLLIWSVILGLLVGSLQLLLLPLLAFFSPLPEVQEAARMPSIIGALLQAVNCIVWTGEGIQQGNESFLSLAVASALATAGMLFMLKYTSHSLLGVWSSFGVLACVRLLGVLRHHFVSGPLAPAQLQRQKRLVLSR